MDKIHFVNHRRSSILNSGRPDSLLMQDLFAISFEFATETLEENTRCRKRKCAGLSHVNVTDWQSDDSLKATLEQFVSAKPELFAEKPPPNENGANETAKAAAARTPSAYFFQGCCREDFSNPSGQPRSIVFQNREFLLPPSCCGILGTLGANITSKELLSAAENLYKCGGGFDLIVMDPPWINKSVKRQRRYITGSPENILCSVPTRELLAENGLLVVWYTHNESHYVQLKAHLEDCNLRILANWTWLKVTTSGAAICPFGRNFKKPYEHLLLAARPDAEVAEKIIGSDGTTIVSVPSAVHSHKPNLDELLEKLSGRALKNLRCLELFARSLKSNWVCAGNEVLKLQCTSLFSST